MNAHEAQSRALEDILTERMRQDRKWGEQNNDPFTYLAVLVEEVGEFSQAALHSRFGGDKASGLHEEAVQVAAVALAIVECLNRGKWQWPTGGGGVMETAAQRVRRILASITNDDAELVETYTDNNRLVLNVKDWARKDGQAIDVTIRIPIDEATITEG